VKFAHLDVSPWAQSGQKWAQIHEMSS